MNLSQTAGNSGLGAILALHANGSLVIYSGAQPATPETALSGNTDLVQATYANPGYGAQSVSGGYTLSDMVFTAATYAPSVNGAAVWARAYKADGTTVIADYTIGFAWLASTAVAVGVYCANGGNTYQCTGAGTTASSGGPSGTGSGITDGTVTWAYVGAGALYDVSIGNPNVQTGTSVAPAQVLKLPVV